MSFKEYFMWIFDLIPLMRIVRQRFSVRKAMTYGYLLSDHKNQRVYHCGDEAELYDHLWEILFHRWDSNIQYKRWDLRKRREAQREYHREQERPWERYQSQ